MTKRNYVSIIVALLGAVKIILAGFGIDIPDETFDTIANGIAALATVVGIIMSHRKPAAPTLQE